MSDLIRTTIDTMLMDLNVCLPAKVVKYNAATQMADVLPMLLVEFLDGTILPMPVIPSVPVVHPKANQGSTYIHVPITVGDNVILIFSQRSLDNWKTQGGPSNPSDPRKHHLTDAFAIPGGSALPESFKPKDPTAVEIANIAGFFQVKPSGIINIGAAAPTDSAALASRVESRLSTLETGLNTLITSVQALATAYTAHTHPANIPPVTFPPVPPGVPPTPFIPSPAVVASTLVKVAT